jgi:signal transduction histidine kinase
VAHEIRNPLGMIQLGVSNLTQEKAGNQDYLEQCKRDVSQNIDRINTIVRSMLSLPKSEKKERHEIDLVDIIESVLQFFSISKVKLIKEFSPVPKIKGNPDELKQAFINLIDNASKAMPEGGELKIRVYQDGKQVVAEVSDTGEGIAEADLPRIFDPFFSTHHESAGLGLSIVYRIVREHEGDISVSSKKGKGTIFALKFPTSSA